MAYTNKHQNYGGMNLKRGKEEGYEGSGTVTTDGSGDVSVDLSGVFSSIDFAIIQIRQETTALVTSFDAAADATAGELKFRVFTASTGAALAATEVEFFYIVHGSRLSMV